MRPRPKNKNGVITLPTGEQIEPERPLADPAMPYRMRGRKIMSMPLTGEAKKRYDENYCRIYGHE